MSSFIFMYYMWEIQTLLKLKDVSKREWYCKWIKCEIVRWSSWNRDIFNSYVYLYPWNKGINTPKFVEARMPYEEKEFNLVPFHWWVTLFEKIWSGEWKCIWVKVWCDFAHYWDEFITLSDVESNLVKVCDYLNETALVRSLKCSYYWTYHWLEDWKIQEDWSFTIRK